MTRVRDFNETAADIAAVRELFWEYLQWANGRVNEEFRVNFDIASMLEEDMATLGKFTPPDGRIVLAVDGGTIVGLGCLRHLKPGVGEIKRMYVCPEARGGGVGGAILTTLVAHAEEAGHAEVRLDSAGFMHAAHALYRSFGFRDIDPYPESEIPPEFQKYWVFMAKSLK